MGISWNCNKRYLTKEDVVLQLNQERKQRLNAEKREKNWKEKFLEESVQLEDGDHADLTTMLRSSKLPVITGLKLVCFQLKTGVSTILKMVQLSYLLKKQNGLH